MAARGSLSEGGEVELLVLLPDGRSVAHAAPAGCPIMDLLVQIASRENLKPSAYAIEAVDSADESRPPVKYKPNTPVGQLNTKVIRLTEKNSSAGKMAPPSSNGTRARDSKIAHSESFSNRVQNFNKMAGVSAVQICNDPDGFNKLSEDTKRIKSRSNFITSTLPPQVTGDGGYTTSSFMNTFRLQIHLPYEQLHVIRASPDYTILDVLDIIRDERGLKLERYSVHKTNEPDLNLNLKSTLKEYRITELTLTLLPEFEIKRSVNPKKVKKENSSHFRSAFKSFFQQLKPSSRSNSVSELSLASESVRPKSEPPRIIAEFGSRLSVQPKAPPRKRGQAPQPPVPGSGHAPSGLATPRSHTASESSCESAGESSVGGSAPATLPRRCRLAPASASTTNLAADPPLPPLRRGVSDMAVNKPKFARRKRAAPKPPTPISAEELVEDGLEEQASLPKPPLNLDSTSHGATEALNNAEDSTTHSNLTNPIEDHKLHIKDEPLHNYEEAIVSTDEIPEERLINNSNQSLCYTDQLVRENQLVQDDNKSTEKDYLFVQSTQKEVPSSPLQYRSVYNEAPSVLNVEDSISDVDQLNFDFDLKSRNQNKKVLTDQLEDIDTNALSDGKKSQDKQNEPANDVDMSIQKQESTLREDIKVNQNDIKLSSVSDKTQTVNDEKHLNELENTSYIRDCTVHNAMLKINHNNHMTYTEDRLDFEAKEPVTPLVNNAPVASQPASDDPVDRPVAVDIPDLKVVPTPQPSAEIINSHPHSVPPLLLKVNDNHLRSTKPFPPPSISSSGPVSKPSVDEILKQIQKIKENKQLKRSQSNVIEKFGSRPHEFSEPKRVMSVPSYNHIDNDTISNNPGGAEPISDTVAKTVESNPPKVVEEKPPNTFTKPRSGSNGSVDLKEIETWQHATDASTGAIERRHMDAYDSGPAKSRVLTKFMLTSWAEEKRAPVVNRIADYGSKGSSTQVSSGAERALASALAATLPRPFARSHSEVTTNFARPVSVNTAPTIINVVEKVNHTKVNDAAANATKRTSAYAKLNLYNMSPTILPDPRSTLYANGESTGNAAPTKPSWELVKDASKKLAETEVNGEKALDRSHTDRVDSTPMENGADKEPVVRHVYKYPKPLQFQLGTWTDKTKTLKIEPEARQKADPPLVTELDEVGVWSATY